jgi:hypothetical protein
VLTTQPYAWIAKDEAALAFDCFENGLTSLVLPATRAWWHPGKTVLIVVAPAPEVAYVRAAWGAA